MNFENLNEAENAQNDQLPSYFETELEKECYQNLGEHTVSTGYENMVTDLSNKPCELKVSGISFTHLPEFSHFPDGISDKGSNKIPEQRNWEQEIFASTTKIYENFQRKDIDFNNEEMKIKKNEIPNEKAGQEVLFQDQYRGFPKTTQYRNFRETKGEHSYHKQKLHKTASSSNAFSSRRFHMPVTRSKSFGGKPNNDPSFYQPFQRGSMDFNGKGAGPTPSLRRQALANAASLSMANARHSSITYHGFHSRLNPDFKRRGIKPREENSSHQLNSNPKAYSEEWVGLDFIGLVPVKDVPWLHTGEVTFCPPQGCEHVIITDRVGGTYKKETRTFEFFHPNHIASDKNKHPTAANTRIISLPDYPEEDPTDEIFFHTFWGESYWKRRHSMPISSSPDTCSLRSPSVWQSSCSQNFSPVCLSNLATCTPSYVGSLNILCPLRHFSTDSAPPNNCGAGRTSFFDVETFGKVHKIPHHPILKRNVSDPQGYSSWHPLQGSLDSPLVQHLKSRKQ